MILRMYTIQDSVAKVYNTPFFCKTDGEALRNFKDLANDRQTTVGQHPEDYALYSIGAFDQNEGEVVPIEHTKLATALAMQDQIPDMLQEQAG
jgi:hypothetical protein